MNREKIREERIFEIVHCPFEGRAKLHHLCQPNGLVGRCWLGGNSKGQCTISKVLFSLILPIFIEQKAFFSERCVANKNRANFHQRSKVLSNLKNYNRKMLLWFNFLNKKIIFRMTKFWDCFFTRLVSKQG